MSDWLSHHHSHADSPVHRLPAALKLAVALILMGVTVTAPPHWHAWFASAAVLLGASAFVSRLPLAFVCKRLMMLSPFVIGVAFVSAFQTARGTHWLTLALKSSLCLLTVVIVSNTTPFSKVLRVLRRLHISGLLITTLALMHRYLFVLAEESERMRRARLSRTFTSSPRFSWRTLPTVIGQLFIRASERAERIYDAMCARGWK